MSENLYTPQHKTSNPKWREEYDRIFKKERNGGNERRTKKAETKRD